MMLTKHKHHVYFFLMKKINAKYADLVERMVKLSGCSSQAKFAAKFTNPETGKPLEPNSISLWKKRGVGQKHVIRASEITGIPAHEIRPDIYPPPSGISK